MTDRKTRRSFKTVLSFAWIAVAVCLALQPAHAHKIGRDAIYFLSAGQDGGTMSCGSSQQIGNWNTGLEVFYAAGSTVMQTGAFDPSTGLLIAPAAGIYQICASLRNEDYHMDVTLRHNNTRIAAFGNDVVARLDTTSSNAWMSTGTCKLAHLQEGDTITLWYESGTSNDCAMETTFKYSTFEVVLLGSF